MDAETFNAAKEELEHAYFSHMIDRQEYHRELKELRKERQDDRNALIAEPRKTETEQVPLTPRRLYSPYTMKLYRSRRRQIFFTGDRNRRNSKKKFRR